MLFKFSEGIWNRHTLDHGRYFHDTSCQLRSLVSSPMMYIVEIICMNCEVLRERDPEFMIIVNVVVWLGNGV